MFCSPQTTALELCASILGSQLGILLEAGHFSCWEDAPDPSVIQEPHSWCAYPRSTLCCRFPWSGRMPLRLFNPHLQPHSPAHRRRRKRQDETPEVSLVSLACGSKFVLHLLTPLSWPGHTVARDSGTASPQHPLLPHKLRTWGQDKSQ